MQTNNNSLYWAGQSDLIIDHRVLVGHEKANPDVQFFIDEKNSICAHSFILNVRMPLLLENSSVAKVKKKKKKNRTEYTVEFQKSEHITHQAVLCTLHFAYCGQIEWKSFTPFKAVEVLKIAAIYKLDTLHFLCSKYMQEKLDKENIFKLLKLCDSMSVEKGKQLYRLCCGK
jgi:hypothetical protein